LEIANIVPVAERKKRNEMLRILSEKKRQSFYHTQIGQTRKVLWESENDMGLMYGFTDNYVKVAQPFLADSENEIEWVTLGKVSGNHLMAKVTEAEEVL